VPASKPYYITKRTVGDKKLLYAQFPDTEGRLGSLFSITALAHKLGYPKTVKIIKLREADRVCTLALERGLIKQKTDSPLFKDFVLAYWDFEGPRIQRKNKLKPNSIGRNHAYTMTICFTKHAIPQLPEGLTLQGVTAAHLRKVLNQVTDEGSLANATIAKVMKSMTTPLREAYKKEIIQKDPTRTLDAIDESGKEKGILTPGEFSLLLSWMRDHSSQHILLATVLAAATGMRKGEIRALRADDITIVNDFDSIIKIDESYSDLDHFKIPKAKKTRQTPCPRKVAEALLDLAKRNPNGDNLIFWAVGNGNPNSPVSPNYLSDGFYDAMKAIGISEELRRTRNITFHSLRHYFITRAGFIMGSKMDSLRLTVGHESLAMTDHYTHSDYESMKSVAEASRKILGE
jgi:integrase